MIAALILAATVPQTAVEADRALAAAVAQDGEYAAFRRYAAPDAVMFYEGAPHSAREALANRREPRVPLRWRLAESISSCDGTTAYTIGSAQLGNGGTGTLLLIWRRQPDGAWKWVGRKGFATGREMAPGTPRVRTASCAGTPPIVIVQRPLGLWGRLQAPDRTLVWAWVQVGGAIETEVRVWNGTVYATAVGGG